VHNELHHWSQSLGVTPEQLAEPIARWKGRYHARPYALAWQWLSLAGQTFVHGHACAALSTVRIKGHHDVSRLFALLTAKSFCVIVPALAHLQSRRPEGQ